MASERSILILRRIRVCERDPPKIEPNGVFSSCVNPPDPPFVQTHAVRSTRRTPIVPFLGVVLAATL